VKQAAYKGAAARQRGIAAVEFALLVPFVLLLIFGIMEFTRLMYLRSSVQQVTRQAARAAAVTNFKDSAAMAAMRKRAMFGEGKIPMGGDINQDYIAIDYFSVAANGAMVPVNIIGNCPTRNIVNCAQDPYGAQCIRLVRARFCLPGSGSACAPVPFRPMLPLFDFLFESGAARFPLPSANVIVVAESLGNRQNRPLCP
jgi:uncharacterized protein (UPF0333 family)